MYRVKNSPKREVAPGIHQIWVSGIVVNKGRWLECSDIVYVVEGLPGTFNTLEFAEERRNELEVEKVSESLRG